MSAVPTSIPPLNPDVVARFLGQHYGDRSVYLSEDGDRWLLATAQRRGLVSQDGQLTTAGYEFWQRHRASRSHAA